MTRKSFSSSVLLLVLLLLVLNNASVGAFPDLIHEQITKAALSGTLWDRHPSLSIVIIANQNQDNPITGQAKNEYHFDNCKFKESLDYIIAQRKLAIANAQNNPLESVRAFGRLLHAVQDFYAHSNWIELKASQIRGFAPASAAQAADKIGQWDGFMTGKPTADVLAAAATYNPTQPNGLVSGTWFLPLGASVNCPTNTPRHGLLRAGLNKDTAGNPADKAFKKGYGVSGHEVAKELARRETIAEWLRLEEAIFDKYGWPTSGEEMIDNLTWAADFVITGTKGADFQVKPSRLRLQVGENFGIVNKGGNTVTVELVEWPGDRPPEPLKEKIELRGTGSVVSMRTLGWKPGKYVLKFDPPSQLAYTTLELISYPYPHSQIEFWTTDNEPDRVAVYEVVAARFMAENPDIEVQIVPIQEADVRQRIATAMAAGQLPDIVRMGIERVAVFAAEGILGEDAAEAVIANIGTDDFRAGPLAMVTNPATGKCAAVPYDGWIQAIWYRTDMFAEAGLNPPISWDDINAAVDTLPGTGNLLYALTLATDPGQNYPHQVFEQVAMSNDAWPFDEAGNVTMNTPEMIEALRFYTDLQRGAMPGPQYWRGAREAYELDQAGMLFYSTYIMDDLVEGSGLAGGGKVEIAVEDLPRKTGFAPQMVGPNGSASYGQLVTLGIIEGANPAAQLVVEYFLTEGYIDILALFPFGKVPVLESAVDEWKTLSPYFAHYSSETLDQIANGFETMQRWLFRPDYDPVERAVIGDIEGRLLIPQVISNILDGIMTPESAAAWLQEQVEAMLAERQ